MIPHDAFHGPVGLGVGGVGYAVGYGVGAAVDTPEHRHAPAPVDGVQSVDDCKLLNTK